jgi:hypothetical protein
VKFKVEMFIIKEDFEIPTNKSKSMINALQREAVQRIVEAGVPGSSVTTVRKVQEEGVCT